MSTPKLLEVRNLRTYFDTEAGTVKAVDGISFTLHRGETVGIVGESGSGKSVTSLSVMRLLPIPPGRIAGGEIWYYPADGSDPIDLVQLSEEEIRHYRGNEIAMIFQEPMTSLNPVYRCGDQVVEAIRQHHDVSRREARARTLELFEQVQLPLPERVFKAYPHELSGGQKQRVMIAMALSCDPDLLIADEPTTALDVTVQQRILQLMEELKQQVSASVMFITHDLGVVAEIADRVIVMYKGRIVEQGPVRDIFRNPQHPYTKGLLACRPPLGYRLRRLPVVTDFMQVEYAPDGERIITERAGSVQAALEAERIAPEATAERLATLQSRSPILEVDNLRTWFAIDKPLFGKPRKHVKAVDGVSFEVYPGETLGLVGESGCGKTTLGRTLLRLVEAHSGQVKFEGRSLLELSAREMKTLRRDMQIIFQDPYSSLNPRMTIGQAILEPMQVHRVLDNDKQRRARVIELLETVSLSADQYHRYPHEFSGGQRQRICIARALALQPRLIICDESVSALDVSVQAQVLNLLLDLRERFDLTYIFISHDLSVVRFMSDRMIVMNQGKIEEMGPADEIYANPQQAYTQRLIAAIPQGEV